MLPDRPLRPRRPSPQAYLLNVAAKVQNEVEDYKLILGIEEPELYQHPPQARFLSNSLANLASGQSQVIITTHSPFFVTGRNFESIRTLRKRANSTNVHRWTIDEQRAYCAHRKGVAPIGADATLSGLDRALLPGIAEMFFANKLVLVEGAEDEAIITEYLDIVGLYSDFLLNGGHIVSVGGKQKIPVLLSLARGFSIDTFCVFDFDMNLSENERANNDLIRYAKDVDVIITDKIENSVTTDYFFASVNNIQATICDSYPNWKKLLQEIAIEWGWNLSRMDKDPMLLREGLRRATSDAGQIEGLDELADCLQKFWQR